MDKAIEALQSLVLSVLLLYGAFALSFSSVSESIREREALSHLVVWLNLNQLANQLPTSSQWLARHLDWDWFSCDERKLARRTPEQEKDKYAFGPNGCPFVNIAIADATKLSGYRKEQLRIENIWPKISSDEILMYLEQDSSIMLNEFKNYYKDRYLEDGKSKAKFYSIIVPNSALPYSDYEIDEIETEGIQSYKIYQRFEYRTSHTLADGDGQNSYLVLNNYGDHPKYWDDTRLMLLSSGLSKLTKIDNLNKSDWTKEIVDLVATKGAATDTTDLFGLKIPLLVSFSIFQFALLVVAFLIIGPLRAMHKFDVSGDINSVWVFVTRTNEITDRLLEFGLLTMSVAFALAPIIVFAFQVNSSAFSTETSNYALVLGFANLAAAVVTTWVYFQLAMRLRALRRTTPKL